MKLILKLKEKWKASSEEEKKIREYQTSEERKSELKAWYSLMGVVAVGGTLIIIFMLIGIPHLYLMSCPIVLIGLPGSYFFYKLFKLDRIAERRYKEALNLKK